MYSLTQGGVLVSIIGTGLVYFGFSEQCSNELIQIAPVVIGGLMSWIGRMRKGDVDALGFKK
jgi:hypothetical protein